MRWITQLADGPPPTGDAPIDAHDVLEVRFADGSRRILDPMANVWFDHGLADLIADPAKADVPRDTDARYDERGYAAYATSAWYRRIARIAVRSDPDDVPIFVPRQSIGCDADVEPPRAWRRSLARIGARARYGATRWKRSPPTKRSGGHVRRV